MEETKFIGEVWKYIPDWEDYQASSYGRIKSMNRIVMRSNGKKYTIIERIMTSHISARGYLTVKLVKDKKHYSITVHTLIAMAFHGYIRNGKMDIVVDHRDEIKLNNRADNLQLLTNKQNLRKYYAYNKVELTDKKYNELNLGL